MHLERFLKPKCSCPVKAVVLWALAPFPLFTPHNKPCQYNDTLNTMTHTHTHRSAGFLDQVNCVLCLHIQPHSCLGSDGVNATKDSPSATSTGNRESEQLNDAFLRQAILHQSSIHQWMVKHFSPCQGSFFHCVFCASCSQVLAEEVSQPGPLGLLAAGASA